MPVEHSSTLRSPVTDSGHGLSTLLVNHIGTRAESHCLRSFLKQTTKIPDRIWSITPTKLWPAYSNHWGKNMEAFYFFHYIWCQGPNPGLEHLKHTLIYWAAHPAHISMLIASLYLCLHVQKCPVSGQAAGELTTKGPGSFGPNQDVTSLTRAIGSHNHGQSWPLLTYSLSVLKFQLYGQTAKKE